MLFGSVGKRHSLFDLRINFNNIFLRYSKGKSFFAFWGVIFFIAIEKILQI